MGTFIGKELLKKLAKRGAVKGAKKAFKGKKDPAIARARKKTAKNIRETRALKKDLARGKKVLKKAKKITGRK